MGGKGSGRWHQHNPMVTVEECLILSATELARSGVIALGKTSGHLHWQEVEAGQCSSTRYFLSVSVTPIAASARPLTIAMLHLSEFNQWIGLQQTFPRVGGVRWWFTCPTNRSRRYCFRRVEKLYLPPGENAFACRHCYKLSYESRRMNEPTQRHVAQFASSSYRQE